MQESSELADRISYIVEEELPALTLSYEDEGYGIDSYTMALGHACGWHRLPAAYAPKIDRLYRELLTRQLELEER